MNCEFELSQAQLLDIATSLKEKIIKGVRSSNQELPCLPTFIPISQIPERGRALVVDFEQSSVEAAVVWLEDDELHVEQGPISTTLPFTRGAIIERDELFNTLAELIVSLEPPHDLPLGYRFAYPTISTPEGDSRLLRWTHEWFARDTVGENMGQLLVEYLAQYTPTVRCSNVTVINDTVASLLAGLTVTGADGYIGMNVGTGNNMATFMEPDEIPKLPDHLDWKDPLPINLESGNFVPPHLTKWDDLLDAQSQNPGEQRLEKAVSGIYLAPLLTTVCPECGLEPEAGSDVVVMLANETSPLYPQVHEVAQLLLSRSAKLVAATVAGLIAFLNISHTRNSFCIVTERELFREYPYYREIVQTSLKSLLNALGLSRVVFQLAVEESHFLGSAIAALSRR